MFAVPTCISAAQMNSWLLCIVVLLEIYTLTIWIDTFL